MTRRLECLADGFSFLEGPRWRDGHLWASDMHGDRVVRLTPEGSVRTVIEMEQPSGLGWLPDGRLLVVSMVDRTLRRVEEGRLVLHADLSGFATFHCNDMVVDAAGRAYVGNFGYDYEQGAAPLAATLVLVHPDGRSQAAASDLWFPNGCVLTPDGRTMILAETMAQRLTAFDVAPDGTLSGRREWAALEGTFPDGICLDAAGAVWVASPLGNEVLRVEPAGRITERIEAGRHVIACALGGDDRRTLFVLTTDVMAREAARARVSARFECVRVEVPGAGWP